MNDNTPGTQTKSLTKPAKVLKVVFYGIAILGIFALTILEFQLGPLRHQLGATSAAIALITFGIVISISTVAWLVVRYPVWTRVERNITFVLAIMAGLALITFVIITAFGSFDIVIP